MPKKIAEDFIIPRLCSAHGKNLSFIKFIFYSRCFFKLKIFVCRKFIFAVGNFRLPYVNHVYKVQN